jgi:psiF repeat
MIRLLNSKSTKGETMKKLIPFIAAMILSMPLFAADNACMATAAEKKLSGSAQSSFIRKCVRDSCEATSQEKKLAGAAKNSFTKKCLADGLMPYCEKQATGKKLAGAAKTSFMNKCQSGN